MSMIEIEFGLGMRFLESKNCFKGQILRLVEFVVALNGNKCSNLLQATLFVNLGKDLRR